MKKSKTRIYVDKSISLNLIIYIKNKQHHFLRNVLRVKINDQINVFDGITGEWNTNVISINRSNTVLRVTKNLKKIKKSPDLWLIFSPIKQQRMNISIQKATELGVSKIIPCLTEYANIRKINLKNLYDNAIESSEQSERMDIPKIENLSDLNSVLSKWPENRKILFCDEKISDNYIFNVFEKLKNKYDKWAVLIGPEGGFSDKEGKLIKNNENVISVSLGDKVLRSDTAITVSLFSILQFFYR